MFRYIFISLILPAAFLAQAVAGENRTGTFILSDWDGPPLTIHYVEPEADEFKSAPVVIVLHGVRRNADDYAANWHDLVSQYGFRVYAPEFSKRDFRGAEFYNLGGIGTEGPYAYAAFEPLFEAILARGSTAEGYYLFGHSAGAQVVHRALLFEDLRHLHLAFAANAGWYTMPDENVRWPYGLAGTPANEDDLRVWFARPMMLLLGEEDTDPQDPNLRRSLEALSQGRHRFERGATFLYAARDKAAALKTPFVWRGGTVPGVAHDNAGMAKAAAPLIAAHAETLTGDSP